MNEHKERTSTKIELTLEQSQQGVSDDVLCQPTTASSGTASAFRDISVDVIHRDFIPFSLGPYYATYLEGSVVGSCEFSREEWDAPHQLALMIMTKEVFKGPFVYKTVVDQFPTPREMSSGELLSLEISAVFKSRLVEASPLVAQTDYTFLNKISEHDIEPLSIILQLEPEKLARSVNISASRDAHVSPHVVKESTVTHVSASLELPSNIVPTSSTIILVPNEE
nr:hypothetical protein [Tanacetum cinerariifolium]